MLWIDITVIIMLILARKLVNLNTFYKVNPKLTDVISDIHGLLM